MDVRRLMTDVNGFYSFHLLAGTNCDVEEPCFGVLEKIKEKSNVVQWMAVRKGLCRTLAFRAEDSKM